MNARELHTFLDVSTRYNDWINKRIRDYGFLENQDFLIVTEKKVTMTDTGEKVSLLELLGGYSAREYKKLDSHYDVLLSRAEDALEKEK